ncbi:MAG TPA: PilZ domain-containing protein [Sedimentisphaerales bacterium]
MSEATTVAAEQRKTTRTPVAWPVSVWLPEANRFFNGRSSNISSGGALVRVPATTPLRTGHVVELNFPRTMALAKRKGNFARIKSGRVVRIERSELLDDATIGIGIVFEGIES